MRKTPVTYNRAAYQAWQRYSDSIFPTEESFLHHLFFVNGNGYEWERGALIEEIYGDEKTCIPPMPFKDWRKAKSTREAMYPICQYARCLHFPDDIRPDWLAALKRALVWASTAEHHKGTWIDKFNGMASSTAHDDEDHYWLAMAWAKLDTLCQGQHLEIIDSYAVAETLEEVLAKAQNSIHRHQLETDDRFFRLRVSTEILKNGKPRFFVKITGFAALLPKS